MTASFPGSLPTTKWMVSGQFPRGELESAWEVRVYLIHADAASDDGPTLCVQG